MKNIFCSFMIIFSPHLCCMVENIDNTKQIVDMQLDDIRNRIDTHKKAHEPKLQTSPALQLKIHVRKIDLIEREYKKLKLLSARQEPTENLILQINRLRNELQEIEFVDEIVRNIKK